jgi:hypothetical protein
LPQTSKLIADGAEEDVEIYYYAESDDTQLAITERSDTPSAGNKIVRKIWYTTSSQADPDADVWTLYETLADNATFAELQTAFEASLLVSPTGGQPVSIKTTWEEVTLTAYLLDTYSGADYAYDLRLLSSTYTGDAINVRRASDNAVQDIGFDANGDLDTSALASFCSGTDGFIVRWYDQSGNGADLVQSSTSQQPQIVSSGSVILENGKPKVQGALGKALDFSTLLTGSYKIYSVGRVETNCVFIGSNSTADYLLIGQSGSSSTGMFANASSVSVRKNGAAYTLTNRGAFYTDFAAQHALSVEATFSFVGGYTRLGYGNNGVFPMMSQQALVIYPSTSTHAAADIEGALNTYYTIY